MSKVLHNGYVRQQGKSIHAPHLAIGGICSWSCHICTDTDCLPRPRAFLTPMCGRRRQEQGGCWNTQGLGALTAAHLITAAKLLRYRAGHSRHLQRGDLVCNTCRSLLCTRWGCGREQRDSGKARLPIQPFGRVASDADEMNLVNPCSVLMCRTVRACRP